MREAAAWFAMSRRLALLAVGLVSLLALGGAAAFIMDAVEVTSPQILSVYSCIQNNNQQSNIYLDGSSPDPAFCQWNNAISRTFPRKVLLRVEEVKSGAFQATATVSTVVSDPLVTMVQHGDGQDPDAFFDDVIGDIIVGGVPFTWSAPTATLTGASAKAVVSTTGQLSDHSPIPGAVQLQVFASQLPETVELSTQSRIIAGISEGTPAAKIASESAHSLTAGNLRDALSISLQPGSPQPFSNPPGEMGAHWVARASSAAWGLLSGFASSLVSAGAWIAVFLASRMRAFGAVGRSASWRRMERVLGAAVAAHLVISACSQLITTDGDAEIMLFGTPSLQERLSLAMTHAGLWAPTGYVAVEGGVLLLIAFALGTVAWDAGGRERPPACRSRIFTFAALAAGVVVTIASYVALAYSNTAPPVNAAVLPNGALAPYGRPPIAIEIPVVTLCALLVVFLAANWVCGALPSALLGPVGSPGRVSTGPASSRVSSVPWP